MVTVHNLYQESIEKALILGYEPTEDPRAFADGYVYKKDGVIWIITTPEQLAIKLKVSIEELEKLGYSLDDYYEYQYLSPLETIRAAGRKEMLDIFSGLPTDAEGLVYLSDGMYMTEEGDIIER
ncbi:hypothetical protein [Rodentibacter haemolyticus]|uniref:Uncharacterized protein n=1 Tax=Rodentibacter haemolyticus TaxID=2778911 RepID=A0ABX6V1X5_9PAST|nr:hypothetical protein [Rodentibacter haemolyticus]QPB43608.1 hypothetical protein IHV77_05965 [Rodentibacter haemolyticus]